MGRKLDFRSWSHLKIDFLLDHIEAIPHSPERVRTRLHLARILRDLARWQDAEPQSTTALQEAETLRSDPLISLALDDHAQLQGSS
jgi:hypothetical protein